MRLPRLILNGLLLVGSLLLGPQTALAEPLYFCDCGTNSEVGCVQGNDANSGTNPSSPKRTLTRTLFNNRSAGDTLWMCRGGAFDNFSLDLLRNTSATPTNPLIVDAYNPDWGGLERPRFNVPQGSIGFIFAEGAAPGTVDGGYILRNIWITGPFDTTGGQTIGLQALQTVSHLTIDNVRFTGMNTAYLLNQDAAAPIDKFTLKNSIIEDTYEINFGCANDMLLENNSYINTARQGGLVPIHAGFRHTHYFACNDLRSRVIVRNNYIADTALNGSNECTGGNFTVHGLLDQFVFENNTIVQPNSNAYCMGISLTTGYGTVEGMTRGVVRGNVLVNVSCSICANSTPGLLVENNIIVHTVALEGTGIEVGGRPPGTGDMEDTGAIVQNNTLYMHSGTAISISPPGSPANQVVSNNLTHFWGTGTRRCFAHGALGTYTFFDRNLCNGFSSWSSTYASLAAAQSAGFDVNGLSDDPLFVAAPASGNSYSCRLQAGSPAINRADLAYKSSRSKNGWLPLGRRDIGACEFGRN